MKTQDKLAELIHSLSKSEKRYFKLYAQRHTIGNNNKYLDLFDAIDKQRPFDKEAIFKKFKGDAMLNNFNVTKKRLYDHTLKALEQFHAESTINAQLNNILNAVEILYKKGLYEQSLKRIKSGKKLADDNDHSTYLLLFSQWEVKLLKTKGAAKTIDELNKASKEEAEIVQGIQDQIELEKIKSNLISFQHHTNSASKENEVNAILKKIEAKSKQSLPVNLQFEIKSIQALASYIKGDVKNASHVLKDKLSLYLSHETRIQSNPSDFMSDLANLIHLECSVGNLSNAREHLSILKSFPKRYDIIKTENFEIRFFATQVSLELSYYMHQIDFNKIISFEEHILEKIEQYKEKFPETRKAYFYYMLSIAHFYLADYKAALHYSNLIANSNKIIADTNISIYNKWLEIFIHFELGHFDLIKYKTATVKKYLKKNASYSDADNEIFNTLSKITNSMSLIEKNDLLEKHYQKIKQLDHTPLMKFSNSYFDYISWIASKISGGNLKDQLKRA